MTRIDDRLGQLQNSVNDLDDKLTETQEKSAQLQSKIPVWIDLISITITILLLWVILSQVSLFSHGYRYFNGRDLLQREHELS